MAPEPTRCSLSADGYDESLRSATCLAPAALAVYDRSTLEIIGHACSMAHVLPGFGVIAPCGTYSTTAVCGVCGEFITDRHDVVAVGPDFAPQHTDAYHTELRELAEDEAWAMAQRTPEGFGGESEDES
jgi:hypothetical protein